MTGVAKELALLPDPIRITGYAGRQPALIGDLETEKDPWVRATFLAASTADFLMTQGRIDPTRLHIFGMANTVPPEEKGLLGEGQLEILVMRRTTDVSPMEIPDRQPRHETVKVH